MAILVPQVASLANVYPDCALPEQSKRWRSLTTRFEKVYGHAAQFVSRSPGRVNLIGEHIDYMLFDVLPMAISPDMLIAVAPRPGHDGQIRISNVMEEKFPSREFSADGDLDLAVDAKQHEWTNYFKAGYNGALKMLRKTSSGQIAPVGMDVLVDGSVPSGSGLSSSAAFVCATVLATLIVNGKDKVDQNELVQLAIVAERAVGVNSGGMDQSASVLAVKDNALFVSFVPELSGIPIKFPSIVPEITFVIAQTFVQADKHVTAPMQYNLRVVECSLATLVLANSLGIAGDLKKDLGPLGCSLRGLQDTFYASRSNTTPDNLSGAEKFAARTEEMLAFVDEHLSVIDGYSKSELCSMLNLSSEAFDTQFTSQFPIKTDRFYLRQRATHVFSEALRVLKFKATLQSPPTLSTAVFEALGTLMNQSQASCRDLYDCSCDELEEICDIARRNGSYGSRLTGAGWGGCCVHLVPADCVERVISAIKTEYYNKRFPQKSNRELSVAVVKTQPGGGACFVSTEDMGDIKICLTAMPNTFVRPPIWQLFPEIRDCGPEQRPQIVLEPKGKGWQNCAASMERPWIISSQLSLVYADRAKPTDSSHLVLRGYLQQVLDLLSRKYHRFQAGARRYRKALTDYYDYTIRARTPQYLTPRSTLSVAHKARLRANLSESWYMHEPDQQTEYNLRMQGLIRAASLLIPGDFDNSMLEQHSHFQCKVPGRYQLTGAMDGAAKDLGGEALSHCRVLLRKAAVVTDWLQDSGILYSVAFFDADRVLRATIEGVLPRL